MREDRSFKDIRKISFETGINLLAEGSCLAKFGNTQVLCTASIVDKIPHWLKNENQGWLTAEYSMLPNSSNERIRRDRGNNMSGRTQEIQRLIGRSLRAVSQLEALGERTIWIDCDVIQADGGTRTASITGGFVALVLALQKMREASIIDSMPVQDYVAATSVGIVGGTPILDLAYEEDSSADVDMNVVNTGDGRFIEVQGTAEMEPFGRDALDRLLELADIGTRHLIDLQRDIVGLFLTDATTDRNH